MKKLGNLTFTTLFVCMVIVSYAQVEKGNFVAGAKSDFGAYFGSSTNEYKSNGNTTSTDGPKSSQFNLSPTVGYFFIDGLSGGLFFNVDIDNSKEDQQLETGGTETLKDNSSTFTIGPIVRYYYPLDKFVPFGEFYLGVGSTNYKYDYIDYNIGGQSSVKTNEMKYNLFDWGLGAGGAFFIVDNVSVDAMIGYKRSSRKYKDDNGNTSNNKGGKFGVNVGFTIFIPCAKTAAVKE